jgi:hypothetical protein
MKKITVAFFLSVLLFVCAISLACTPGKKDEVLYLLHDSGILHEVKRKDGDQIAGGIQIKWSGSTCSLNGKIVLNPGDEAAVENGDLPPTEYIAYLGKEGCQLPDDMVAIIQRAGKIRDAQNEYGTIDAYRDARDREKETAIIQQAIDQAELDLSADKWYDFFIEATWYNGDLSIAIVDARARLFSDPDLVEIIITDGEGNEMNLDGFTDDTMFGVGYRGEAYYGPLE